MVVFYLLKIAFFVWVWTRCCQVIPDLPEPPSMSSLGWVINATAFQKAILWSMQVCFPRVQHTDAHRATTAAHAPARAPLASQARCAARQFEVLGMGCASGPLTGRNWPPFSFVFMALTPGRYK